MTNNTGDNRHGGNGHGCYYKKDRLYPPKRILKSIRLSRRRRRRREGKQLSLDRHKGRGSSRDSILWKLLLVGLLFCLADIAYILSYVDAQHNAQRQQQGRSEPRHRPGDSRYDSDAYRKLLEKKTWDAVQYRERLEEEVEQSGLSFDEVQLLDRILMRHGKAIYNTTKNGQENDGTHHESPTPQSVWLTPQERKELRKAKKPILDMIHEAGIPAVDDNTLRSLPTWEEVTSLYGDEPVIIGLNDQCEAFQAYADPADRFVSTAGTFNSGTNLMAELLIANCHMEARMQKRGRENRGVRWQVPWGKHSPPGDEDFRLHQKTERDARVNSRTILPAVTIRDPYVWMGSMCRHEYTAHWHHDPERHCPNLLPDEADLEQFGQFIKRNESIPVHIKYNGFWRHHDSMVHLWNDWYREYLEIKTMNRLLVRFEDLLFHPKAITTAVCKCAGGQLRRDGKFEYVLDSAKKGKSAHGPMETRTGFIKALIKYGKRGHRLDGFTPPDLQYAKEHLDPKLMKLFRYIHPE